MKKKIVTITITIGILLAGGIYLWWGERDVYSRANAPRTTIELSTDSTDFGTFPYAETKRTVFRFRNTGERPLIIKNVVSSCGCAEVTWNKRPIAPGKTDSLVVDFRANSLGQFNKTVEMICNTEPERHLLHLKGFVEE
jgi:hypothetical protein